MKCCDLLQSKYLEPSDNLHDLLLPEENSINILNQIIVMMFQTSSDTNINTLHKSLHSGNLELWWLIGKCKLFCENRGVVIC